MADTGYTGGQMAAALGLVGTLGLGGGHFGGEFGDDPPVQTGTIGACEYFTKHGREHEKAVCEIQKNLIRFECLKGSGNE